MSEKKKIASSSTIKTHNNTMEDILSKSWSKFGLGKRWGSLLSSDEAPKFYCEMNKLLPGTKQKRRKLPS